MGLILIKFSQNTP